MTPTAQDLECFQCLSPTLKKTAALLAHGLSRAEIAEQLCVSMDAVASSITRLHAKVGFDTTLKLVVYIVRHPQIEKILREAL